jgi:cytochrome bd ubiquinol oxidase subunit II
MLLQSIWFLLVFVLLIGYAVLDGFDLGVGILHIFARGERERRISLNAIAPVWDGNEVWLLTAGGALFAAFPPVYATVFSGLYIALMLLLVALISRAVAIELRSKIESDAWKRVWDIAFFAGSLLPALLLGVAFGNVLRGLPINAAGDYTGTFLALLNPYAVLVGVLVVVAFTMHGAIYLAGKCDGQMHDRLDKLVPILWILFISLYIAATIASVFVSPFLFAGVLRSPLAWVLMLLTILAGVSIRLFARTAQHHYALFASAVAIGSIVALCGVSLYPRLVPSLTNLDYSLLITNSSSTPRTLLTMLVITLIGVPIMLAYTVFVYRIFRGKVVLDASSY